MESSHAGRSPHDSSETVGDEAHQLQSLAGSWPCPYWIVQWALIVQAYAARDTNTCGQRSLNLDIKSLDDKLVIGCNCKYDKLHKASMRLLRNDINTNESIHRS